VAAALGQMLPHPEHQALHRDLRRPVSQHQLCSNLEDHSISHCNPITYKPDLGFEAAVQRGHWQSKDEGYIEPVRLFS
jgi:hypothetical protein